MREEPGAAAAVTVERVADIASFRERVEPYLLRDEARHNLILGILTTLTKAPDAYSSDPPYLALVTSAREVECVALRTPPYNLLLSEVSQPSVIDVLTSALLEDGVSIPGVVAPMPVAEQFAAVWKTHTGQIMERKVRHGVYQLRSVILPPKAEGSPRHATLEDRDLLVGWMIEFGDEIGDPVVRQRVEHLVDRRLRGDDEGYWLWEVDGQPVSLTGFGSFTPHGARIGPVYTPADHRRHGYATALVAYVSQDLLDTGRRFCFLYTDLANPTSNSIYQKIGYEWVCGSEQWAAKE